MINFEDFSGYCRYINLSSDEDHKCVWTCEHPRNIPKGYSWGSCDKNSCPLMKKDGLPKLVRDDIPRQLASKGIHHDIEILSKEEYIKALEDKLCEEFLEYRKDQTFEELVDISEVIRWIALTKFPNRDLNASIKQKRNINGSFSARILLKNINKEE